LKHTKTHQSKAKKKIETIITPEDLPEQYRPGKSRRGIKKNVLLTKNKKWSDAYAAAQENVTNPSQYVPSSSSSSSGKRKLNEMLVS
jgi:hypothetical protein